MKLYVIVERNYEYDDEVYNEQGYTLPKEAFQVKENADKAAALKNFEWLGRDGELGYISPGEIGWDGVNIFHSTGSDDLTAILKEAHGEDADGIDPTEQEEWSYGLIRCLIKELKPEYRDRVMACFGENLPYTVKEIEMKG